jgi:hypothetical protein
MIDLPDYKHFDSTTARIVKKVLKLENYIGLFTNTIPLCRMTLSKMAFGRQAVELCSTQ